MSMTSTVPYLLRGINEWILDNGCTPFLVVDATAKDVSVPAEHVKDGQIVLNISPTAVRELVIDNEFLSFNGRFQGVPWQIYTPMSAVLGIITRENGEGMWFPRDDPPTEPDPPEKPVKPSLRVIK
jgi:stringent starvation protein B